MEIRMRSQATKLLQAKSGLCKISFATCSFWAKTLKNDRKLCSQQPGVLRFLISTVVGRTRPHKIDSWRKHNNWIVKKKEEGGVSKDLCFEFAFVHINMDDLYRPGAAKLEHRVGPVGRDGWCTKFQPSLLNTSFRLSGFQASLLLIYLRDGPNRCLHCTKECQKPYPICDAPLWRSALCSLAPSQKSRGHNRSWVWTEALSGMRRRSYPA